MTVEILRESSLTLVFNSWSNCKQSNPGLIIPVATLYQGDTIVVRPCDGPCLDYFCIYVFIYIAHVVLYYLDGMNYLVADGVNSLRKGHV
jgi:hypothetical protein